MKRISFNKGKDFYSVQDDRDIVYSKLNKKSWDNIVDKMDPTCLVSVFNSTIFVKPTNGNIKDNWMYMLCCYLEHAKEDLIL